MKSLISLFALAAVAACHSATAPSPSAQQVSGAEVVVALNDTASLGDTGVRVRFVSVMEDSRCPIDAVCIWAGNARIALDLSNKTSTVQRGTLNTNTQSGAKELTFSGYLIQLVELDPAPQASDTSRAYQARLRWRSLLD